MTLELD